jgi:hypothetical protein
MSRDRKREVPRYWEAIQSAWDSVSIYDGPKVFLEQFREVDPAVGHLLAAHWCQSEVSNGGLHQFFTNPTGVLAPEALAGFRAIGLEEWASILEEAIRYFGEPYPRDQKARIAKLPKAGRGKREVWDPFHALDDRFYEWSSVEPIGQRFTRLADDYANSTLP